MSFRSEEKGKFTLIQVLEKRGTLAIAQEFKNSMIDLIGSGSNKVLFDLSGVDFVDSTFLGALVLSHKKAVEMKGAACFCGLQKSVKATFQITMLDKKLTIFNSVEEAEQYLNNL